MADTEQPGGCNVILISTHTCDRVPSGDGSVQEVPGGPAWYMGAVFDRLGCTYQLVTGERPTVKVLMSADGEQYVIPRIPPIVLPPTLHADAVILSPVINEIDTTALPPISGLLVVDLQGFVREPDVPSGQVGRTFELEELLRHADVVKASAAEMALLTEGSRRALSGGLVLETRGSAGAILHRGPEHHEVPVESVPVSNTIGAGDTFLAAFVVDLVRSRDPIDAMRFAAAFTTEVLRERASR